MAYAAIGPLFPVDLIAESTSFGEPSEAHANVDFLGTVPPRLSVKKVTPVFGQVTRSGSVPRTSNSCSLAARALFQRLVASTESVALPPYSRPCSSYFKQPSNHCGWMRSVNSTFLFLGFPNSAELFFAK